MCSYTLVATILCIYNYLIVSTITMTIKMIVFLLCLITVSCAESTTVIKSKQNHVIYVDSTNGTTDINCLTRGLELPCQNLEIALEGAKQIKDSAVMILHPTLLMQANKIFVEEADTHVCPTWMNFNSALGKCECGIMVHGVVKCNASLNQVSILDCYMMTFDEESDQVIVGRSFYGCGRSTINEDDIYHEVPSNKSQINIRMCSHFNREGRLCGTCKKGYSPLVYSYNLNCIQCSEAESQKNWFKAAAVAFIPLTLLYVFAMLLNFNANSPSLHGFVLLAQLLSTPTNVRVTVSQLHDYPIIYRLVGGVLITLYSIWSLDFFRILYPDICLKITTLQALFLEYSVAMYPPLLILFTYVASKLHSQGFRVVIWAWKPFQLCLIKVRKKWDINTSMIDVFATFLLLSYHKLLSVNFDLLLFVIPLNSTGDTVGTYLYYDASYEYFGRKHLPYGLVALVIFICFNILPFLLLLLYPMTWFQRCLNHFKLSHLALHTFVDAFSGCYKDGTEPETRDYRYFAAFFLLLRILLYIAYEATLNIYFYGLCALLLGIYAIAVIIAKPYKPRYNKFNTLTPVILIIMAMIVVSIMNVNFALIKARHLRIFSVVVTAILTSSPQFYIIGLLLKWIYRQSLFKVLVLKSKKVRKSDSEMPLLIATEG